MEAIYAHWPHIRALEHSTSHQVWLVYFQVWTGWSLKTEPVLVSYLNSTPPWPRPWQHFHACTACLLLVGHANLSLIRGPGYFGSLGCVSISQLMEAMCLQMEKKTPKTGVLRMQTCLAINGSKAENLFKFWVLFLVGCWPPCWLTIDNTILDDPIPKHEGPFHQRQRKQLRFFECQLGPM